MATSTRNSIPAHYLGMWGLLMSLALGYIGAMSFRPDVITAAVPQIKVGALLLDEDDHEIRSAAAEAETLRRQLYSARAEINAIRGELTRRADRETTLALKLAAIEARDAKLAEIQPAEPSTTLKFPAASKAEKGTEKTAEKVVEKGLAEKQRLAKAPAPSAVERLANAAETPNSGVAAFAPTVMAASPVRAPRASLAGEQVETASISAGSKETGGPVAIQLGTVPSVDALRLNWMLLSQRHQTVLQKLQPRYTASRDAPAGAGGAYDLIAGPLPSAADAQRTCEALRAQNVPCKVSAYSGNAL